MGITWPELLECSIRLLDSSLDGKPEEEILNWEPEVTPMPETDPESVHMIWMLCPGPPMQPVPNSCLIARAVEDAAEEDLDHKPVMKPVQDSDPDGQLKEMKEYEYQSYVEKTEETQLSYDAGGSDQELEDAIRLEVLRLGRQVNATDADISMDQLRSEGWRRWNTDISK